MIEEAHKNDVGTAFIFTVYDNGVIVDLTESSAREIVFRKPSGMKVTKNGTIVGEATAGQIRYVTQVGDLDEVGRWNVQAIITFPNGSWHSQVHVFHVDKNL